MSRYALMQNGVVGNVVEQESMPTVPGEWVACPAEVGPGYAFNGSAWLPPSALVPAVVSPRQFKQALSRIGLRAAVESAVAAADQDTQDWYRESTEFQRHNPVLVSMGTAMGKTAADIDALFVLAATL